MTSPEALADAPATAAAAPETPTPEKEERAVVLSDPKAIRALAHGVRLQVIEELFDSDESFTATELGHKFGLTPSAMSYHLRSLERWGLVVRAEGHGDGRERHWRSAGTHLTIDTAATNSNTSALGVMDMQLNQLRERLSKHLTAPRTQLPEGMDLRAARRLPTISQGTLYLSEEERVALSDEIWELIARFRRTTAAGACEASRAAGSDGSDVEKLEFFFSFVRDHSYELPEELRPAGLVQENASPDSDDDAAAADG